MFLFTFILVFYAYVSEAKNNLEKDYKCYDVVQKKLNDLKSKNEFRPHFSPSEKILRSPTHKLGSWIQISSKDSIYKSITHFTPENTKIYSIDANCKLNLSSDNQITKNKKTEPALNRLFLDSDLERLIKKDQGFIYVMNPSFAYSTKFYPEVKAWAKTKKLKLTPLWSVRVKTQNPSLTQSISTHPNEIKFNRSLELKLRQMDLHSPNMLFYKNGKLAKNPIIGVHSIESLNKFLKNYEGEF